MYISFTILLACSVHDSTVNIIKHTIYDEILLCLRLCHMPYIIYDVWHNKKDDCVRRQFPSYVPISVTQYINSRTYLDAVCFVISIYLSILSEAYVQNSAIEMGKSNRWYSCSLKTNGQSSHINCEDEFWHCQGCRERLGSKLYY